MSVHLDANDLMKSDFEIDFLGANSKLNYINVSVISKENLEHRLNVVEKSFGPSERSRITVRGLQSVQSVPTQVELTGERMDIPVSCNTVQSVEGNVYHLCKVSLFSRPGIHTEFHYTLNDTDPFDFVALVANSQQAANNFYEIIEMERREDLK